MLWGLEALGVFELAKDWEEWENQSPAQLPAMVWLKLMPQTGSRRFLVFFFLFFKSCFIHTAVSCVILVSLQSFWGYSTCTWGEFLSLCPTSQISSCWCSTTQPIIPLSASIWCHLFPGLTRLPRESEISMSSQSRPVNENLNQETLRLDSFFLFLSYVQWKCN